MWGFFTERIINKMILVEIENSIPFKWVYVNTASIKDSGIHILIEDRLL